ncbi:sensor histidine kinase [Maribacter thermophilus]|uniref:sensor histidine kinase n=1 Tax=Maribacter thermophilus TaxID=1197874 RepID=UPI0012F7CD01|nr:HAMP domain-containing sensor histidine kinase [Maribacter thermophilus]
MVLFLISIIGLSIIQYQYLKIGLDLAKVQFGTKVENAGDVIKEGLKSKSRLTYFLGNTLQNNTPFYNITVDSVKEVSYLFLDDYIKNKLVDRGVDSDYSFRLFSKDSVYNFSSPKQFGRGENVDSYQIELEGYLPELLGKSIFLELRFNNLYGFFMSKLNGLTLPSILFLLGICITVIWVLRTYYGQSRLIVTTNEFINNLTHELKTPVFSIGLATKILDEKANQNQRPVLSIIKQQVNRLSVHIDKVLELASLESGKKVITLETVNFRFHLQRLCEEFKTLMSIENGEFTYVLEAGEYIIRAEVFHLENAINNILDNAKKYADKPLIGLKAYIKNDKLHIEVTDNGKGVSKEDMKRIFQKFYRVTDGDLHRVKGYGLGLSYVKKIMEKHKGRVQVESKENVGTKITLVIPTEK